MCPRIFQQRRAHLHQLQPQGQKGECRLHREGTKLVTGHYQEEKANGGCWRVVLSLGLYSRPHCCHVEGLDDNEDHQAH